MTMITRNSPHHRMFQSGNSPQLLCHHHVVMTISNFDSARFGAPCTPTMVPYCLVPMWGPTLPASVKLWESKGSGRGSCTSPSWVMWSWGPRKLCSQGFVGPEGRMSLSGLLKLPLLRPLPGPPRKLQWLLLACGEGREETWPVEEGRKELRMKN